MPFLQSQIPSLLGGVGPAPRSPLASFLPQASRLLLPRKTSLLPFRPFLPRCPHLRPGSGHSHLGSLSLPRSRSRPLRSIPQMRIPMARLNRLAHPSSRQPPTPPQQPPVRPTPTRSLSRRAKRRQNVCSKASGLAVLFQPPPLILPSINLFRLCRSTLATGWSVMLPDSPVGLHRELTNLAPRTLQLVSEGRLSVVLAHSWVPASDAKSSRFIDNPLQTLSSFAMMRRLSFSQLRAVKRLAGLSVSLNPFLVK
jgi:hypothetical protein